MLVSHDPTVRLRRISSCHVPARLILVIYAFRYSSIRHRIKLFVIFQVTLFTLNPSPGLGRFRRILK